MVRARPPGRARKSRKSPTQSRSLGTVDIIVNAAGIVLHKYGRAGFSTNRIAKIAGVSVGSIYQYFPGKEAIFVAFMSKELAHDMQLMGSAMTSAVPLGFVDGVRVILRQLVAMYHGRRDYVTLLFEELNGPRVQSQIRARRQIEQGLSAWIAGIRGRAVDAPLEHAAFVTTRAVLGVLLARYFEDGPASLDPQAMEDELHRLATGYLAPHLQ